MALQRRGLCRMWAGRWWVGPLWWAQVGLKEGLSAQAAWLAQDDLPLGRARVCGQDSAI